jgi:PhnB protein
MTVKPVPEGYHTITPYLSIKGAAAAIDFYMQAFGAKVRFRLDMPNGQVGHAELKIGDTTIMLAEECAEEAAFHNPLSLGGTSVALHLYVEDSDELFIQAVKAGGKVIKPVEDQFYGDRTGTLQDPYGHIWFIATHKEDLSPEELNRRAEEMFRKFGGA